MKKLLFTFFALILCTSLGWGAVTKIEASIAKFASDSSWSQTATTRHPYLQLDENVSVKATGTTNGNHSTNRWFLYQADNNGEFTISAKNGYWIDSIGFNNSPQKTGVISRASGKSQSGSNIIPSSTSINAVNAAVNAQSITLYIGNSADVDNGTARIYTIYVNYDLAPTGISLNVPEALNATVGNKFQIIATVAPSTTVFQAVKWTTSNASAVDVDQNGIIDVKGAGQATITATTVNGKTATCVIDAAAASADESIIEYFTAHGTSTAFSKNGSTQDGEGGLSWILKNWRRDATNDKIGDVQGTALQYNVSSNTKNYIAYTGILEGGVKRVAFQWRTSESSNNPVYFDVDYTTNNTTDVNPTKLAANAAFAEVQQYSRDIEFSGNKQLRIRLANGSSNIVFGPVTVTPYLLYTNKTVDVYNDGYINDDLIKNTTGEDVVYSLIGSGDSDKAEINSSTGAITIKAEGTITVQASWNSGKVTTTYTATLHKSPAPEVAFTDGETVTKSMNLETYTNALNWTSDPTKCGAVTYESDNEEIAKFEDETVNVLSIVGAGKVNITAHIAKGSEFAAKDITYELTVEDPNEDAITETFKAYNEEGWNKNETTEAEKTGDYFKWNVYLARHATTDLIESERATCFNAGDTKDGYIVSKAAVEGGIKRIGFNWKKNGVADGTFQVIVGSNTHTINSGATTITKAAYNHNFFEKSSNATLKIFNNSQSKLWVGDIKITPYLLYTRKDTTISAVTYVGSTYSNDKLYNNTNDEGTISYSIEEAVSKAAIATIEDPNSDVVTIHGAGTVKVIASWNGVEMTSYNLTIEKATPTMSKFYNKNYDIFETYSQSPEAKIGTTAIENPVFEYSVEDENIAYVDASGNVIIKATGQTNVTCTLKESATYNSVSQTKYLKVTEPVNGCWKENFDSLGFGSSYKDDSLFNGCSNVLHWRTMNFLRGKSDSVTNADGKKEQGIRIAYSSNKDNMISYQGVEEGGIKAIFFNWRPTGTGSRDIYFNIQGQESGTSVSESFTGVTAGTTDGHSYKKELNITRNEKLTITIPSTCSTATVFGPVTIKPYLLYTLKADTINMADYTSTPYINNNIINNTDVVIEVGQEAIEFSALPTSVATINEEGKVTVLTPGDVTITAKWGNVTTSYSLHINRLDLDPSTLTFQIADNPVEKDMNAEPFYNVLTVPEGAGTVTYTSDKENVAKVDLNSGLVTIVGAGNATITAHVGAGTLYNATSKDYTVSVSEPVGEKRIFEAFTDSLWNIDAPSIGGDLGRWNSYKSRRKTTDIMADGQPAIFFLGDVQSYLETQKELEGGIKRMSFVWYRAYLGKDDPHPADSIHNFSIIMDDVVKDTIDAGKEGWSQYHTYSHNFGVMKNVKLKLENTSLGATKIDTIRIVPYIYYMTKSYEKQYEAVKGGDEFRNPITDNTGGVGVKKFYISDESVATINPNEGFLTAVGPGEAIVTASWKPSDDALDSVTATYQLILHDKQDRSAQFAHDTSIVARGENPDNVLTIYPVQGDDPAMPAYTLESADTCVAKIVDNAVVTVAPGKTVITAHIEATSKCKAKDLSYTLFVTYQPTGQYWFETMKNIQGGTSSATTEEVNGEDGVANKWKVTNVYHKDQINGKTGTRVRYTSSIATNEGVTLEGGIKEVLFSWRVVDNSFPTHFTVTAGSTPYEYRHGTLASADDVQPFAHDFNVKSNATLSISNAAQEDPQQSHIIIDSIKVIPYLYYKTKTVEIDAKDYVEAGFKYTNDDFIKNIGSEGTISYSVSGENADKIAKIEDSSKGEVSIVGEGTVTVTATWSEGATTSYTLKINLETPELEFGEKTPVVLLEAGSYTQEVTLTTPATGTINYSIDDEPEGATMDPNVAGKVNFTATGIYTIRATFPQQLPYKAGEATYTLTVNNKPTPTVVFEPKTVDMNAEAFTPEAKTIPSSGMGTASYVSSNLEVAKIEEGKVTIVGEGTSTISVHYEEGDEWGEADVDFLLTVTDVLDEDSIKESFANDADWQKACTTVIDVDGLFGWKTYLTRHRSSGDSPDALTSGEQATWFNNSGNAYLKSANAVEGGIKRVAFNWKKETVTAPNVPSFTVKVDNEPLVVDATDRTGVDQRFNHNYFVKKNVALEIDNNTASLLRVGAIKITPYLYYETKKCTLDLKVKENFKNEDLIDNRDDKATSSISYSIIAGNEGSIAEIAEDGTITATAGGEITVQAQWSSNTSVTTTYTLTILPSKTTINLMRNDDTSDKDVIENTIGQVMPEITLPTRDGYRFNAYFIDQACTAKRFTVTTLTYTGWVSNITYPKNGVKYTGDDRIWIYSGNEAVTLYADWKPERTITLDNQEATEAGTEEVVTAYCENNNLVNLMDPITIPQKENHIFRGYYTEEEGAGTQLIDANGAFIANVTGYTDTEKNYKKWIKDEDITLYAKWEKAIEMKDNEDNEEKLTPLVESGESITFYLTRSFTAGEYNTICLPFNVNEETMKAKFGENYELATLDSTKSASLDDAGKNLSIYIVAEDSIKAGLPYLIKLAAPVQNPSFEQVVVKCAKGSSIASDDEEGKQVQFCGLLSPKSVPADKSVLFVVKNDKLAWNSTGTAKNMNGMRAYFHVDGVSTGVAARLAFYKPNTPTDLMQNAQCTMQGVQKVLINDQIYIIRNGVYYNVSGQIVR